MLNCAFQKNPASGASTGLSSLFFGSSCPLFTPCCSQGRLGCAGFSEGLTGPRDWNRGDRFQIPSLKEGNNYLISHFRPDTHIGYWGESHRAEKCHYYSPQLSLHTCSVIRGESKEELWTGDKCLIKISQDSKATTKQPSSKTLPFLFTQSMSLLFSVLKHQNEIYRVSVVTRIATIKLKRFCSFRAQ